MTGLEQGITIGPPASTEGKSWIGLLIFGIMMVGSAIFSLAISAESYGNADTSMFPEMEREFARTTAIFGVISLVIGIVLIILSSVAKRKEAERLETLARIAEEDRARTVREIADAVKSTIKIRCRYCGTLNEENETSCSSCGASL